MPARSISILSEDGMKIRSATLRASTARWAVSDEEDSTAKYAIGSAPPLRAEQPRIAQNAIVPAREYRTNVAYENLRSAVSGDHKLGAKLVT
jgi:hypothetical protein